MVKYGVAIVVGCLYITCASWLVRSEGRAHRDFLAKWEQENPEPKPEPPRATVSDPLPAFKPRDETKRAVPLPSVAHTAPEPKAPDDRQSPPVSSEVVVQNPKPARMPVQPPAPEPLQVVAVKPVPVPPREWADSLDLTHLKRDDEVRLGHDLHLRVKAQIPALDEGDFLKQVEIASRPFLAKGVHSDVPYTFSVLDSDAVNAFSHPGNYVYVCRGLFDLIAEGEEYVLEFVVGHEVAHLELRHAIKLIQRGNARAKEQGIGTLRQFDFPLVMAYPDEQEYEADAWAFRKMISFADRSPHEARTFMKRFKNHADRLKFPNGHKEPEPGSIPLENHFRAHPPAWKRLERLTTLSLASKPAR